MKSHYVNELNNFISGWYIEDTNLLDNIILAHSTGVQYAGRVGGGEVDLSFKNSTDVSLNNTPDLYMSYSEHLQKCVDEYINQYPMCNNYDAWNIREPVTIQKYTPPAGGFHAWHTERTNTSQPSVNRHLVFMTYLNDVDDAGETEFYHQKIKIKPEKGLTLIWGADWTFTHRGIPSPTQEKYITTGWFSYI